MIDSYDLSKNMSNKTNNNLPATVLPELDSMLADHNFSRKTMSKKYSRTKNTSTQIIEFFFSKPSDGRSLASIELFLEVQMPDVNQKALELVKDPFLLANAPEQTIRQQGGLVTPKKSFLEWTPRHRDDLEKTTKNISRYLAEWAIPFLDAYQTKEELIVGIDKKDERLPAGASFFIHVIAAMLLLSQREKARAFFATHFDTEGRKARYSAVTAFL